MNGCLLEGRQYEIGVVLMQFTLNWIMVFEMCV